jgi:hypothetical protein
MLNPIDGVDVHTISVVQIFIGLTLKTLSRGVVKGASVDSFWEGQTVLFEIIEVIPFLTLFAVVVCGRVLLAIIDLIQSQTRSPGVVLEVVVDAFRASES